MKSGKYPHNRLICRAVLAGAACAFMMTFPAAASEWQRAGNDWVLTENGERPTGWQQKDGSWYYLGGDGVMRTRWLYQDPTWYYLRDSGAMATGWTEVDGFWYYLEGDGSMRRADLTTDEAVYSFRSDGSLNRVRQLKNQGGGAYRIDFFSDNQQEIADDYGINVEEVQTRKPMDSGREFAEILEDVKGRIVGMGKHDELMQNCEVYQEIAYSQLSREELGA